MAKATALPEIRPDSASYKYWLSKRGLTQRALSLKIGVVEAVLSHAFHGRRPMTMELLKAIARGLDVNVSQLVDREARS